MKHTNKGFFLVIEGLDGSGKTEVSRQLAEILNTAHPNDGSVKLTFEPHDPSCAGLFIRQVLTKKRAYDPRTLALAFAANRADHLVKDIIPFLEEDANHIVICDRYYLSSLVYQATDNISIDEIMKFNSGAIKPNLIIFLNASDSTCYQRMRARAESKELFEANLRNTREKYLNAIEFLRERDNNIVEVMADGSLGEVLNNILDVLRKHGPDWLSTQFLLPMDWATELPSRVISVNGTPNLTFVDLVRDLVSEFGAYPILTEQNLQEMKTKLEDMVLHLSDGKIAALFINYLQVFGYKILGEIPWSETKALELEYLMPLSVQQRGVALFLNKLQSYALITKKILDTSGWDTDEELPMLSDFVVCLDFSNEHVALRYYERDLVIKKSHISPTVILLTRLHIREMALATAMAMIADEYFFTIQSKSEVKQLFYDVVNEWRLEKYWDIVVNSLNQDGVAN